MSRGSPSNDSASGMYGPGIPVKVQLDAQSVPLVVAEQKEEEFVEAPDPRKVPGTNPHELVQKEVGVNTTWMFWPISSCDANSFPVLPDMLVGKQVYVHKPRNKVAHLKNHLLVFHRGRSRVDFVCDTMRLATEARFVTVTHCNAQHVLQLNVQIAGLVNLSSDDVLRLQSVLGKGAWGT
eukprot:1154528-Pelagomonas_calceolata.AAC.1